MLRYFGIIGTNNFNQGIKFLSIGGAIWQDSSRHVGAFYFSLAEGMALHILWVGLLMGLVTIALQAWAINSNNTHWQTMVFTTLSFSQMGHVLAIRSDGQSIFEIGLFSNKPLLWAILLTFALQMMIVYTPIFNIFFKTQPLTWSELGMTILVSTIIFWAVEGEKWIKRRWELRHA